MRDLVPTTRTVQITQQDIDKGTPMQCSKCPGAIAVNRAFPEAVFSDIMYEEVCVYFPRSEDPNRKRASRCDPPEELVSFMKTFDNGKPVSPISFDLTLKLEAPECLPSA